MEKMAQVTSSVGQSEGGDEANNSDSGDSVFITQKPVPAAARSGRRKRPSLGPAWTQEGLAGGEDDTSSSSSSDGEFNTNRRRKRVLGAPTYRFSFLPKRKRQTNDLPPVKIKKLHKYAMGGYFKSVQELWESYEEGVDLAASLPTVDVLEEWISPISEEEKEETIEDEDIKVVERKRFATSFKAKSSQTWYTPKTRSGEEGKPSRTFNGSQGDRREAARKVLTFKPVLTETSSSAMQPPDHEVTPFRVSKETVLPATSDVDVRTRTETPKTGRHPKGKKFSSGSVTALSERRTHRDRDPHTEVLYLDEQSRSGNAERGHESQNLPRSDVNNDALSVKRKKEKKMSKGDCKSGGKGREQSPEDEEDLPGSKPKKKKKKPAAEEGSQEQSDKNSKTEADWKKKKRDVEGGKTIAAAEPPTDELKKHRKVKDPNVTSDLSQTPTKHPGEVGAHFENTHAPQETLKPSFITRKKHKKKKTHLASADGDVSFCDNDAVTNPDLTGKKKRKKKMVDISLAAEKDENVDKTQKKEQDAELETKKKKLKENLSTAIREDTIAAVNHPAFVQKKKERGTTSFLTADEEENVAEEQHNPSQAAAEKPGVSAGDFAARSAELTEELKVGVSKKKKKKSAVQERVEGETEFKETPEAEEVKKKKKCKRSDGELAGPTERDVEESPTDTAVSPRKKKKKKDTQEIPPAATEDAESMLNIFSSDSPKKKLKKKTEKAADKLSPQRKSCPKPAESEAHKTKQTERTKPEADFNFSSASEASSHSLKQKKKRKRKLYDQNQDFLSDV